jgi:hypothetical protein
MYRQQIEDILNDLQGACDMYKFLFEEFEQIDTLKLSNYINIQICLLSEIEQKIKARQYKTGAPKPTYITNYDQK